MKFALYTVSFSPHQIPLARAIMEIVGEGEYRYVSAQPVRAERRSLGWGADMDVPWHIKEWEHREEARRIIEKCSYVRRARPWVNGETVRGQSYDNLLCRALVQAVDGNVEAVEAVVFQDGMAVRPLASDKREDVLLSDGHPCGAGHGAAVRLVCG